jgi:hypothetical protein
VLNVKRYLLNVTGLELLVDKYLDRKCVDERDSVYALLSINPTTRTSCILIAYEKALVCVYYDVFASVVEECRGKERDIWFLNHMYRVENLPTVFSQLLCWILYLEIKVYLPPPNDHLEWSEERKKPDWSSGESVQNVYVRAYITSFNRDWDLGGTYRYLEEKPSRKKAQSALLGLCCGEDIGDKVVTWLEFGNESGMPGGTMSTCEYWPLRFPEKVRNLSRLELFVVTFGNYRVSRMEWSTTEIVIHVLRNPAGLDQRVVMQRATGKFKVYNIKRKLVRVLGMVLVCDSDLGTMLEHLGHLKKGLRNL